MAVLGSSGGVPLSLGGSLRTRLSVLSLSLIDFVATYSKARPVVQRTGRGTAGNVPVLFAWTGPVPSAVQARVMQGTTVVLDWTALTGLSFGAVTASGILPGVPLGTGYTVQIRDGVTQPTSGPLFSAGSQQWGVGVVVLVEGQSNMVNTMGGDYSTTVPGSSLNELDYWEANTPGAFFDTAGWHGPGVNDGTRGPLGQSSASLYGNPNVVLRLLAKGLATKYGKPVPVGLTVWAWNSQSIAAFVPGGGHYADLFGQTGTSGTAFGMASPRNVAGGDFEAVLWHQGEADQGSTTAAYIASLQTLYQGWVAWVAQYGRTATDLAFLPAVLGNYDPTACPAIENIRVAVEQFCAQARAGTLSGQAVPWPLVRVGWACIDLWRGTTPGTNPPTDSLHFASALMQRRSARRAIQSLLYATGCATFDGAGPSLPGTYTRSGLVATLDVTIPSGTALATTGAYTTGAPTGWYANTAADFSGTSIAVTAALSSNKVAITFPGGTAFPAYVKHCGGHVGDTTADGNGFTPSCYPDIRNLVCDTASYPTGATGTDVEAFGLPLRPNVGAITIN